MKSALQKAEKVQKSDFAHAEERETSQFLKRALVGYTMKLSRFLLIGSNIGESISPEIHNAALKHERIRGVYRLHQIRESSFDSDVKRILDSSDVVGFNVTAPYKERIIPYLDRVDPRSKMIGAVNTVSVKRDGGTKGYNTDVDGILASMRNLGVSHPSRCVLLGAGGAARACAYTLLKKGCDSLLVLNRSRSRAQRLRIDLEYEFPHTRIGVAALSKKVVEREIRNCDLLVNAVTNPFPLSIDFAKAAADLRFFDLWYKHQSGILESARESGVTSIDGLLMLVEQAASSFEIWTGKKAPRKEMMLAAKGALSSRARGASL